MTSLNRARDLSPLRGVLDGFFTDPFFRDFRSIGRREPHVDVENSEQELVLKVGLAGVDPSEVDISVENGVLRISTASKGEEESESGSSSWYSSWEQSFALPRGTDPADVKAEFDNGLLKVHLPRSTSGPASYHVPIQGVEPKSVDPVEKPVFEKDTSDS